MLQMGQLARFLPLYFYQEKTAPINHAL